jgi:hypothetical protein
MWRVSSLAKKGDDKSLSTPPPCPNAIPALAGGGRNRWKRLNLISPESSLAPERRFVPRISFTVKLIFTLFLNRPVIFDGKLWDRVASC